MPSSRRHVIRRRNKKKIKPIAAKLRQGASTEESLTVEEHEAARIISRLLSGPKVDLNALRREVAWRGVPTRELRLRVWPLLLDVDMDGFDEREYRETADGTHRDSGIVEVDVVRSLWSFTQNWTNDRRENLRQALKRVLNGAVCSREDVYYYQGLHDIASVLLLTLGEPLAYASLCALTTAHLRDFTRPTLEPVKEILLLLNPLLAKHDRKLHDFIARVDDNRNMEMGLLRKRASRAERARARSPPYFAIAWVITLFSHSLNSLKGACRLFDLFFATHPLMPIYVAAVAMSRGRESILACSEDDFPGVHTALKNLDILAHTTANQLACDAILLFENFPPSKLIKASKRSGIDPPRASVTSWVPDSARAVSEIKADHREPAEAKNAAIQMTPGVRAAMAVLGMLSITAISLYQMYIQERYR